MFEFAKTVVGIAVSACSGAVVGLAVKAVTPSNITKVGKVVIGVGSVAIGGYVGVKTGDMVMAEIDGVKNAFDKIVRKFEKKGA